MQFKALACYLKAKPRECIIAKKKNWMESCCPRLLCLFFVVLSSFLRDGDSYGVDFLALLIFSCHFFLFKACCRPYCMTRSLIRFGKWRFLLSSTVLEVHLASQMTIHFGLVLVRMLSMISSPAVVNKNFLWRCRICLWETKAYNGCLRHTVNLSSIYQING